MYIVLKNALTKKWFNHEPIVILLINISTSNVFSEFYTKMKCTQSKDFPNKLKVRGHYKTNNVIIVILNTIATITS